MAAETTETPEQSRLRVIRALDAEFDTLVLQWEKQEKQKQEVPLKNPLKTEEKAEKDQNDKTTDQD